jgi:5-methylthioribose kinase
MRELNADNAADYLRAQGWGGHGDIHVEVLGGGVSNLVLRVRTSERLFVLKQSRPQLRTRDAWFSDLDRIYREQEVMQLLRPLLPALAVPEVLFADRANYVFAMSHAPEAASVWKADLLAGRVDDAVAERAGRILGHLHESTGRQPSLLEPFRDNRVFIQLRADPFYRRIQERLPDVADAVEPIRVRMLATREALCHGDFSPKNLLVHASGLTLVDYETGHFGDPSMDLGFFQSHLILKAAHRPSRRTDYFRLTEAFGRAYRTTVSYRPPDELAAVGIGHFAVCLLARIDGTSPVDYLADPDAREAMRSLGRSVLRLRPQEWEAVLDLADQALRLCSDGQSDAKEN